MSETMTQKPIAEIISEVSKDYWLNIEGDANTNEGTYYTADQIKEAHKAGANKMLEVLAGRAELPFDMPVTKCIYTSEQIKELSALTEYVDELHTEAETTIQAQRELLAECLSALKELE